MAERRETPKQPKSFAANVAIVISAAFLGLPAVAATDSPVPCPASERATLVVKASELTAVAVSHDVSFAPASSDAKVEDAEIVNSATLLAPRAEAAIRDAFKESDVSVLPVTLTTPVVGNDAEEDKDDTAMITRLPGVTDDELSRFRKQMFRRDI